MLAARGVNGFITESINVIRREKSVRYTCLLRGTIGKERFELWVEGKLCPLLGNWANLERRSIVVIDNVTIHHSERVRKLIMATGVKIIYTAPYSPDLNPIEYYFVVYKSYLKRFHNIDWLTAHLDGLGAVTPVVASIFLCIVGSRVFIRGVGWLLVRAAQVRLRSLWHLIPPIRCVFTYPIVALIEYLKSN